MACCGAPSKKRFKVHETNKRSLTKAIGFRIVEVTIDTLILSPFVELHHAFGLAILIELVCFSLYYIWERIWNKIEYGRHIHQKGTNCKECGER